LKNYKDALAKLEQRGKIKAVPAAADRPHRKGVSTFANHVMVTFPRRR
jgi:hypothetical protein